MAISKLILNGEVQMDVTSDTVTAGSMLSGTTATKNDGTKATGTIANKSSSDLTVSGATVTAPAGYYANAASKAVATVAHPDPTAVLTSSTGMVVAGHTQETGYVTGGTTTTMLNLTTQAAKTVTPTESIQTAVSSYRWTTGNVNVAAISSTYVGTGIPKYSAGDLVASGSGVTVLTGYYSSTVTKLIAAGSAFPPAVTITKAPTIGVNTSGVVTASYNGSSSITPTVTSGYISQGTAGTISTTGTSTYQLTSQAAATYYPSTADQTIASQRWLVGNQTIKSVTTSNLTAANIAEGVVVKVGDSSNASRIMQITGTHKGGSTYTATIINSSGSSNFPYAYVTYNNIKYYQLNDSFTFSVGDTLDIQVGGRFGNNDRIFIDGEKVGSASYSYTLPAHDIEIKLYVGSDSTAEIIFPTLSITENGTYDVGEYERADVNVEPTLISKTITENGTYNATLELATKLSNPYTTITYSYYENVNSCFKIPITWTSLPEQNQQLKIHNFTVHLEDFKYGNYTETIVTQDVVFTGFPINLKEYGGNTSAIRIYEDYIYIGQQWIDNLDDAYIDEVIIEGLGEINGYNSVVVNVGSGFTADKIAMRTMSGDISGNATTIANYAFASCDGLTTASFPSCTSIGSSAFYGCGSLTTVNCSLCTTIGSFAFYSCGSLTTASFPSCTTIGSYAFAYCYSLTTANFPSCTSINASVFYYCGKLTTASFPLCMSIRSYTFAYCHSLSTVNFPSCTAIGSSAFYYCDGLIIASFPSCTTISSYAFAYCSGLTIASFSSCITISNYAFAYCYSLTTASFPSCTTIGNYAFAYCSSLTTASFPSCTTIGSSAFYSCGSLLSLYLLGSSVVTLLNSNAFYFSPIGEITGRIFVPSSLYNTYIAATNWSVYSDKIVSV